jgi:hypothetical protein
MTPLLLLGAGDHHRPGRQPGEQEHQGSRIGVLGHLLNGEGQSEDACARTSEFHRDAQAEQPGVAKRLEDICRVRAVFVDGPRPWLDLVLGQSPDRVAQVEKLVGEFEIHR